MLRIEIVFQRWDEESRYCLSVRLNYWRVPLSHAELAHQIETVQLRQVFKRGFDIEAGPPGAGARVAIAAANRANGAKTSERDWRGNFGRNTKILLPSSFVSVQNFQREA